MMSEQFGGMNMEMHVNPQIVQLAHEAAKQLLASGEESLAFQGPKTGDGKGTLYIQKSKEGLVLLGKIEKAGLYYGIRTEANHNA